MKEITDTLHALGESGNMRVIPAGLPEGVADFSSNDYLGLGADVDLRRDFLAGVTPELFLPCSSASRLLASRQDAYASLEGLLRQLYGREALLFNSGYHANTGMIAALGGAGTLFLADKLVHASIIDGLVLSRSQFMRFRHNDYAHLERLMRAHAGSYSRVVIVAESVYSMDGDSADIEALLRVKALHPGAMLYLDEAHGVGVVGDAGLGAGRRYGAAVDIVMGTFGKALASEGAFAVMGNALRSFMVNRCRSLIFSTALAPATVSWTEHVLRRAVEMDSARAHLRDLSARLSHILGNGTPSHIQPFVVGDAHRVVELSQRLRREGINVLPIRTPTVPAGTERLRFSLSAAMSSEEMLRLERAFDAIKKG